MEPASSKDENEPKTNKEEKKNKNKYKKSKKKSNENKEKAPNKNDNVQHKNPSTGKSKETDSFEDEYDSETADISKNTIVGKYNTDDSDDEDHQTTTELLSKYKNETDQKFVEMESLLQQHIATNPRRMVAIISGKNNAFPSPPADPEGNTDNVHSTNCVLADKNQEIVACNNDSQFERTLTRDIFSMMSISPPNTLPFYYALSVLTTQMLIFILVTVNIYDKENPKNPLGIPPNVDFAVRMAQLIAILISVGTQEDIRTAVDVLYDGYDAKAFSEFPQMAFQLWFMAVFFRFIEGAFGLIVTFCLIISESEVVSLLLNFTAIAFVSQLDEIAFILAEQGYVGKKNRVKAKQINETIYHVNKTSKRSSLRMAVLVIILISIMIGWVVMIRYQQQGAYLCSLAFVQFSDEYVPTLGTFSGIYKRVDLAKGLQSVRPIYVEERSENAMFTYCDDAAAWTFSLNSDGDDADPCEDWLAISEESQSFDFIEAGKLDWFVRSYKFDGLVPMEYFYVSCYDCDDPSFEADDICAGNGKCINNRCQCDEDAFGLQCRFPIPCPELAIDENFDGFEGTRRWSSRFSILKDKDGKLVTSYDHPVFINELEGEEDGNENFDIILFTGRRWILTYSYLMSGLEGGGWDNLIKFLKGFHGHYSEFQSAFISSPSDVGRPTAYTTPIEKSWYRSGEKKEGSEIEAAQKNIIVNAILLCAICSETEACFFNSTCTIETGVCECTTGSQGIRCQVAPVSNGKCNKYFNTPEFNFDGGDCCESTCTSSEEFICGRDDTGFIDIGYPSCLQNDLQWRATGDSIRSDIGRSAAIGTSVALSSNGAILAVSEPGYEAVRVFDKDGSNWIQRGRTIEGPEGSGFGQLIALSGSSDPVVRNPLSANRIILGVSEDYLLKFYACQAAGCKELPYQLNTRGSFAMVGKYLIVMFPSQNQAIFVYVLDESGFYFRMFLMDYYDPSNDCDLIGNSDEFCLYISGQYVDISGDGSIAVAGFLWYYCSKTFGCSEGAPISVEKLEVFVLEQSPTNSLWNRIEKFESDNHNYGDSLDSVPRQSVALSEDGRVLAIASIYDNEATRSASSVKVYYRDGDEWIKRDHILPRNQELDDRAIFAWGVDLSSDGSVIAISGIGPEAIDDQVCVFQWNGISYEPYYDCIPSQGKTEVVVSSSGHEIAMGRPTSGLGGEAQVYRSISSCPVGTNSFRVSITTDSSPEETRWNIVDKSGSILFEGKNLGDKREFTTFSKEICVDLEVECLTFTIYDDVGANGIDSPGGYAILIDYKLVASGNDFGVAERHSFGNCFVGCANGESKVRILMHSGSDLNDIAWSLEEQGEIIGEGGNYDGRSILEEVCVPSLHACLRFAASSISPWLCGRCANLIPILLVNYDLLIDDILVKSGKFHPDCKTAENLGDCNAPNEVELLECEESLDLLSVTAIYSVTPPSGYGWTITSLCDPSTVILEGKDYDFFDFDKPLVEETCLPSDLTCLSFSFSNDLFLLFTDNELNDYYTISRGNTTLMVVNTCSRRNPNGSVQLDDECACLEEEFECEDSLDLLSVTAIFPVTIPPGYGWTITSLCDPSTVILEGKEIIIFDFEPFVEETCLPSDLTCLSFSFSNNLYLFFLDNEFSDYYTISRGNTTLMVVDTSWRDTSGSVQLDDECACLEEAQAQVATEIVP